MWPVLLGVDAQEFDEQAYKIWQDQPHRDSNVVNCDVERSLWSYTEGVLFSEESLPNTYPRAATSFTTCTILKLLFSSGRLTSKLLCNRLDD